MNIPWKLKFSIFRLIDFFNFSNLHLFISKNDTKRAKNLYFKHVCTMESPKKMYKTEYCNGKRF